MTIKKKINRGKLFRRIILFLLLIGIVGVYLSNRFVKSYGFDGLGDFISTYRNNLKLADNVEPKELKIKLSKTDYEFIKSKRDEAMERGLQINGGDNYVDCKVIYDGDTTLGEVRLKGHMTDHLEGEKWSFRVKTEDRVMGMYRFSLQSPGTRNYAYEWVYHELLAYEGIINLQYDFLNFKLNDNDLGIYAVEEHFGQHILEKNERPNGAILRWNPGLYWESRIDEFDNLYLNEDYSGYTSSYPEPYDKGVVKKDSNLISTYHEGAYLLESFRRGDANSSDVFDVEKMARFHAVIDLVGGHHSLDWSDVKFFYNANSKRIEPVGYESFSVRKSESIAGQRVPEDYEGISIDYHNRLFSDPIFFAAYIKELERICDETYLDGFISSIQENLNLKLGVLAHEWPYLKFSFDGYFENIELIRHNLELPKAFHCFQENVNDSIISVSLTPVSDYPIEILGLVIDGKKEFLLDSNFVLPPKARDSYAKYFYLDFKYNKKKVKNLTIKARIPGSSTIFEVEVNEFPSYNKVKKDYSVNNGGLPEGTEWLNDTVFFINRCKVIVDEDIKVEKGKTLRLLPNQKLIFQDGGQIIVNGNLEMFGSKDDEEIIVESYSKEAGIIVDSGNLLLNNVSILNSSGPLIKSYNSNIQLENVYASDIKGVFIEALQSKVIGNRLVAGQINSFGMFDRCEIKIKNVEMSNGENFIDCYGSDIEIVNAKIRNFGLVARMNNISNLYIWDSSIIDSDLICELDANSIFRSFACVLRDCEAGFAVDQNEDLLGQSEYVLYKTVTKNINTMEK